MRNTVIAILAMVSLATGVRAQPAAVEAIDGVDPVLLVQGKEVSGNPDLKVVRGRFEYLFSFPATKATFERNPSQYEIQLNGLCARMGKATGGRPSDYLAYDGKIYIFGSDECHRKFEAEPKKYLPAAAAPFAPSAQAVKEGRALVERVVTVIGGGPKLDGIKTYIETASQTQRRSTGDVPLAVVTIAFSDYRDVDGLSLPFVERASFNGGTDPFLSRRIDAVAINAPLDPANFQPGTPGGQ